MNESEKIHSSHLEGVPWLATHADWGPRMEKFGNSNLLLSLIAKP